MNKWITERIESASWRGFAFWFAVWFAYNWWAINSPSPWTRALAAAGGKLPESQPGFPPIEPQRSLEALTAASATGDYIFWQALDVPYAVGVLFVTSTAIALALKSVGLERSFLRFLLALPLVYVICEAVENSLVAAFAARAIDPGESAVLVQQAATTLKLASGYGSMFLGLVTLAIAAAAFVLTLSRTRK
jgi:hypothetical protein